MDKKDVPDKNPFERDILLPAGCGDVTEFPTRTTRLEPEFQVPPAEGCGSVPSLSFGICCELRSGNYECKRRKQGCKEPRSNPVFWLRSGTIPHEQYWKLNFTVLVFTTTWESLPKFTK